MKVPIATLSVAKYISCILNTVVCILMTLFVPYSINVKRTAKMVCDDRRTPSTSTIKKVQIARNAAVNWQTDKALLLLQICDCSISGNGRPMSFKCFNTSWQSGRYTHIEKDPEIVIGFTISNSRMLCIGLCRPFLWSMHLFSRSHELVVCNYCLCHESTTIWH